MIFLAVAEVGVSGATATVTMIPTAKLNRTDSWLPPRDWLLTLTEEPTSHYQAISAIWTPGASDAPTGTLLLTFQRPSGDGDCRLTLPAQTMISGFNGGLIGPFAAEVSFQ